MVLDLNKLQIGDRLVRTKNGFFSKHHVLIAGFDYNLNDFIIAENQRYYGVRLITLSQFLREGTLVRVDHNNFSLKMQEYIIARINHRLGKAYDLLSYNCEHFVNDVLNGKISSKQIAVGTGLALGITAVALWRASSRQST